MLSYFTSLGTNKKTNNTLWEVFVAKYAHLYPKYDKTVYNYFSGKLKFNLANSLASHWMFFMQNWSWEHFVK